MSDCVDNYRLCLGGKEYIPIITGGMGVNISTASLAHEVARLGGIGHISDAMTPFLSDKQFGTRFQSDKFKQNRHFSSQTVKKGLRWAYDSVYRASFAYIQKTMEAKKGSGAIWVNVMEKLSMGAPRETLKARLDAALDAGIDGITLSAGLHTGTLNLIKDHPRFRDVMIGIIASSSRALKIFLRSAARVDRLPDYVVIEGPLAGGHLGFGMDWKKYSLRSIVDEVSALLKKENLSIPIIPAGGVFTGTDAVEFFKRGASAVQVATRFTISRECGLPSQVKQIYLQSMEDDVEVNLSSPTGYPMRMLRSSPSLSSRQKPNCESLGYILDADGHCSYIDAYHAAGTDESGKQLPVTDKMCICSHFMRYDCYTCGHYVYRLKETTVMAPSGKFYLPPAEHVFNDYRYSKDHQVALPKPQAAEAAPAQSGKNGRNSAALNGNTKSTSRTEEPIEALLCTSK